MKTIEINKNGFGLASLFTKDSTKSTLIEHLGLKGLYLDELGIEFKTGDEFVLKVPNRKYAGSFFVYKLRVWNITEKNYECEFM